MSPVIQATLKNKILQGIDNLPSFSPVIQDIITLSNDLNASPKDLIDLIRTDPVLTAKIIKLVNSAYFSLNSKSISLNRALVLLGFNTIKNIAIATEMVKLSDTSQKNAYFNYQNLWEHMIAVGAVSKFIAKAIGEDKKAHEEFFIAGLIHDIGDFLMMRFLPKEFYQIRKFASEKSLGVNQCTQSALGFSSGQMGALLAKKWKLHERIENVIANVNDPNTSNTLFDVVYLADKFCRQNKIGFVRDEQNLEVEDSELGHLGLPSSFLEENIEAILSDISKAKVFI